MGLYDQNYDSIFRGGATPQGAPPVDDATAQAQRWLAEQAARRAAAAASRASAVSPVGAVAAAPAAPVAQGALYKTGRFLGRAVGRFGPISALGAMGFGMADQAQAIQEDPNKSDLVERGLQVLSGADITGYGGWLGRKLAGRTEPLTTLPARTAPASTLPPAASAPAIDWQGGPGGGEAAPAVAPGLPPLRPWTEADLLGSRIPEPGTGAVRMGRGAIHTIDARAQLPMAGSEVVSSGAAPAPEVGARTMRTIDTRGPVPTITTTSTGRGANRLPDVGGFYGATARLRNIAQDNAAKAAQARMEMQYGGTAQKNVAAAANENLRTAAAHEHLRLNPTDFSGAAGIASGRVQPREAVTVTPSIGGAAGHENDVIIAPHGPGAIPRIETPVRYASQANLETDMAARNLKGSAGARKIIAEYEKRGINTSRLDISKIQ
jgi:hypothetical protein